MCGSTHVVMDDHPPALCAECDRDRMSVSQVVDKELLPIKGVYLTLFAGFGMAVSFLSVFFKQLGFSPLQIGVMSGLRPCLGVVSGGVLGALADKFSKRRTIFFVCLVGYYLMSVCLYLVQEPHQIDKCPNSDIDNVTLQQVTKVHVISGNSSCEMCHYKELPADNISWLYPPADVWKIFWVTMPIVLLIEVFQSPATSLTDAAALQTLGRGRLHLYGRQRAFGSIGWGLSTFIMGALLKYSRQREEICGTVLYLADYKLIAYISVFNLFLCLVATWRLRFQSETNEEEIKLSEEEDQDDVRDDVRDDVSNGPHNKHDTWAVFRIFLDLHFGSFLFVVLYAGVCNGIIWGFLFWHLENLGADQLTLSVISAETCLVEFFSLTFLIYRLIRLLTHMGVIYLGLAAFAVRFTCFAVITNPWYILCVEPLHSISFATILVSQSSYTSLMVPDVSLGTVQGIVHGVYFGLGAGSGFLLGGVFTQNFGARLTFFGFGVASLVVLVMFFIAQKMGVDPKLDSKYTQIHSGMTKDYPDTDKQSDTEDS